MTENNRSRLALLIMITTIAFSAFWLDKFTRQQSPRTIKTMNAATLYCRGLITRIHHNANTVTVKYRVDSIDYQQTCAWDKNPKDLDRGDSILIKYSVKDPNVIFTELDKSF